jgi:thioredoxin reductase (NADPH)
MNDVIIIVAGPVGLYGAYLAGLRGLKGIILESLPMVGGQQTTLYPEKKYRYKPYLISINY